MRHKQLIRVDLNNLLRQYAIDSYTDTPTHILAENILKFIEDIAKQNIHKQL